MSERAGVLVPGKIGAVHLGRDAYMYVRQSTLTQVREHTESLVRQYELRERAVALGWDAHQVRVIDADLGRSGAEATAREGFKDLVADVGLGRVGIVFGIEVSRLARNNADWYQLLDLCALTDTLIADADGVYHPGDFNDRLVLGLKGTMSEAELHLIRSRLTAGLRHKAGRGELRQWLPVGFDYDENDAIVITATRRSEAIATVFRRFAELGSARQVLLSLRGDGLPLPRRPARTGGRVHWQAATYPAVHDLLTNPVYAGAFVFGRTRTEKRIDPAGRVISRTVALPREQWEVLIPDHHAGFIGWDTLRGEHRGAAGELAAAARDGRRRGPGRVGAAAGPDPVRQVRPDDADRVLRRERQLPPVCVRPRQTAVWRPERLPEHRRPAAGAAGPGRGVRRARPGRAGRDRPGARRRRTGPRRHPARCSSSPPKGPVTRLAGPAASTTLSSRRTGSSPAPSNAPSRTSSPRSGKPNVT